MSVSPDIIFQAIDLAKKALEIYHRVEGLPKQMATLGRRLERMNFFLGHLGGFVMVRPGTAYDGLLSAQKGELADIIVGIKRNMAGAFDLFDRYEKGIISRGHDIQFRVKWAAQVWFALVDNAPVKVGALIEDVDQDCVFLNHYLGLMNAQGIEHLVNLNKGKLTDIDPPPPPARTDYKVIFIDPYNIGRSVIAQAWVDMLASFSRQTKAEWRIVTSHSAGFFVRNKSDCDGLINRLDYPIKSYRKDVKKGGLAPSRIPRAALFENDNLQIPDKKAIQDKLAHRTSRGIRKSIFKDYDYILVLTNREHDNMIHLKNAIVEKEGKEAAPRGKGKLLMLGRYLLSPAEILDPPKNADGTFSRYNWDKGVIQIKKAIQGFLKEELDWTEPKELAL